MQSLYARVVLWLIEPALKKRDERRAARFKAVSEMIADASRYAMDTLRPVDLPQAPVFHGVAKGAAKWFELSAQAASPVDSTSPPMPLEVSPPAPEPFPEKATSPGVAPSCHGDSQSCAEDPKTNEEKPLC